MPPFEFPMFSSALGGSTVVNWYITVSSVTAGKRGNEAKGTWSNVGFPPESGEIEPDTWTAQANQGAGDDMEAAKQKEASADGGI